MFDRNPCEIKIAGKKQNLSDGPVRLFNKFFF